MRRYENVSVARSGRQAPRMGYTSKESCFVHLPCESVN